MTTLKDLLTNALGTYFLAKVAKDLNCKNLFIQVQLRFMDQKEEINEKTSIEPDSIYGVSKYAGELSFINF